MPIASVGGLPASSSGGGSFSTGASATILAGASTVSFTYRDTVVGTPTITASSSGLTPAAQQQTIFTATTILHHALARLGFEPARGSSRGSALIGAYQRALLASLRPAGRARLDASVRRHARQLWLSREALLVRFRSQEDATTGKP